MGIQLFNIQEYVMFVLNTICIALIYQTTSWIYIVHKIHAKTTDQKLSKKKRNAAIMIMSSNIWMYFVSLVKL